VLAQLRTYRPYILMFILNLAVLAGVIYLLRRPEPRVITLTTPTALATPTMGLIEVQVSGAVLQPGVYKLPAGTRVSEALDNAGGARPDADLSLLNLARKLNDGEEIRVPVRTGTPAPLTVAPPPATRAPAGTPDARINLNSATLEQLESLPHITPVLAQRIVDYRLQHGSFKTIQALRQVQGFDALFDELKPLIKVD